MMEVRLFGWRGLNVMNHRANGIRIIYIKSGGDGATLSIPIWPPLCEEHCRFARLEITCGRMGYSAAQTGYPGTRIQTRNVLMQKDDRS